MRAPSIYKGSYLCRSLESSKCWQASSASVLAGPWYLTLSKLCASRERLRHKSVKNGRLEGFSPCSWKHKATLKGKNAGDGYWENWLSRLSEVQFSPECQCSLFTETQSRTCAFHFAGSPSTARQVCQVFIARNTTSYPDSRFPHLSSLSCWRLPTILHVHVLGFPKVRWNPIPHLCTLSYRLPVAIPFGYMHLLTDWEGRMENISLEVRTYGPQAKYFPIWPDLTWSAFSIL